MLYLIKSFTKESTYGDNVYITTDDLLTIDDILDIAENNDGDWYEAGAYPILLVGSAEYGMYPIVHEIQWFKFDSNINKYTKIERPDEFFGYAFLV